MFAGAGSATPYSDFDQINQSIDKIKEPSWDEIRRMYSSTQFLISQKMTVTEICRQLDISRSNFYKLIEKPKEPRLTRQAWCFSLTLYEVYILTRQH